MKKSTSALDQVSSILYQFSRLARDYKAVSTGSPDKIAKRAANKWIGRNIVSKLWIR